MNKTWRLYHDIAFSLEQANEPRSSGQIQCVEPDTGEIAPSRELSVQRLLKAPRDFDHWINVYQGQEPERVRYAHLFYDIGKSGGSPLLGDPRIYQGKISHIENTDGLRVWLQHPPRVHRVYFDIPHYHNDLLREWNPDEWQALLDELRRPDAALFVVGNYYREEWHTLRYLASSPSLIRTR
ncbi:hypothetical protein [Lysobacter sp. 22409]|uniref:hypothetical protein n=1 Tax=Lysobacter sp. 22409 TaxID=3453917 RepID=UPI003F863B58